MPTAALAAVIMVSAVGLFDFKELRNLYEISHRELVLSVATTLGVLILGVLPGVLLAVALSLFWLLTVVSRPHDGVLGRVKGIKGFHNLADFPDARMVHKTESLLSGRFTIVEIEHTPKAFTAMNWIIG